MMAQAALVSVSRASFFTSYCLFASSSSSRRAVSILSAKTRRRLRQNGAFARTPCLILGGHTAAAGTYNSILHFSQTPSLALCNSFTSMFLRIVVWLTA
jgi:hypothetical protein